MCSTLLIAVAHRRQLPLISIHGMLFRWERANPVLISGKPSRSIDASRGSAKGGESLIDASDGLAGRPKYYLANR